MRMRISLDTRAPLSLSWGRSTGNELRTVTRIPGGTWRGALAGYVIATGGLGTAADQDADFKQLFLSGDVRFGDLRIEGRRPWPLSARGCTRHDDHPVVDLVADTALKHPLRISCERCGAKIGLPRGEYYRRDGFGHPVAAGPVKRITAHTAIAGRSLRVREGQFFSTEVLERDQTFEGELWCLDGADQTLRAIIGDGLRLIVGRGGTRGNGDAVLTFSEPTEQDPAGLQQRLQALNQFFRESGEIAFTCTLLSPALVFDEFLLARSWIEAEDIAEAAGEPGALAGYEPDARYARMMQLSGWNAQASLPKSDLWAIAPGSAFLFKREYKGDRDAEIDRLARLLTKAEAGIGERWEEGLGEAVFCDEFHINQRVP
jgi:hypothetical protein